MAAANGSLQAAAANANGSPALHQGAPGGGGDAAAQQLLQEFLQVQARRAEVYSRFNAGFREFLEHGQEAALARLMQEVTLAFSAASQQVRHIEAALKAGPVNRPDLAALLRRVQEAERSKLQLTLSWQALRAAHAAGRFSWQEAADRPRASGAGHSSTQQQRRRQQQQQRQLMQLLEQVQLEGAAAAAGPGAGQQRRCDTSHKDQGSPHQEQEQQGPGLVSIKPGFYAEQMQRAAASAAAAAAAGAESSSGGGNAHAAALHCGGHSCHQHGHQQADGGPADPLEPGGPLEPTEAEYKAAVREALQELDACVLGINEVLDEVRDAAADLAS